MNIAQELLNETLKNHKCYSFCFDKVVTHFYPEEEFCLLILSKNVKV